jgi:hypothetical protein
MVLDGAVLVYSRSSSVHGYSWMDGPSTDVWINWDDLIYPWSFFIHRYSSIDFTNEQWRKCCLSMRTLYMVTWSSDSGWMDDGEISWMMAKWTGLERVKWRWWWEIGMSWYDRNMETKAWLKWWRDLGEDVLCGEWRALDGIWWSRGRSVGRNVVILGGSGIMGKRWNEREKGSRAWGNMWLEWWNIVKTFMSAAWYIFSGCPPYI